MSGVLIVSGTDTGIGKTVVAAGIAAALGAFYWKPVQAGIEGGTDSATAAMLGIAGPRILPEAYRLALPASPHQSAAEEAIVIDPARLALPAERPLIVEGAGGLMVPLALDPPHLFIDQMKMWAAPVVLVARTALGTINHSLLSVAALRAQGIPLAGIIFCGEAAPESMHAIIRLADTPNLGCLPPLDPLNDATLAAAVTRHIDLAALRVAMAPPAS